MKPNSLPSIYAGPLVLVRPEPAGQYTAQLVGVPELRATAQTAEAAVEQVRHSLAQWLAAGQLVPIELPNENSLTDSFGHAKNDPEFQLYLEEIRRFRQEEDERIRQENDQQPSCSSSSSIPTT
jgi:hypothetical protein